MASLKRICQQEAAATAHPAHFLKFSKLQKAIPADAI